MKFKSILVFVICIGILSVGCANVGTTNYTHNDSQKHQTELQEIEICKASIATIKNQNIAIISGEMSQGIPYAFYNHPSDGTFLRYKCKVEDGTVLWAMENGRWKYEDYISYEIKNNIITVYDAPSNRKKSFPFNP